MSLCTERSRKMRRKNYYAKLFEKYGRAATVRDLGDVRRWTWIALPASIEHEPDTFEPTRQQGDMTYVGHFEFDVDYGRTWVVDDVGMAAE